MNKRDLARLTMFEAVQRLFEQNSTIIDGLPAFKSGVARFNTAVASIKEAAGKEKEVLTGIATDKAGIRDTLTEDLASLAGAAYSFASETGNARFLEAMDYPESRLSRLSGANFLLVARQLIAQVQLHVGQLADHGILPDQLTALTGQVDAYEAARPAPRNAVALRRNATQTALAAVDEADAILRDSLDKLALQLRKTHPSFHSAFVTSRVILDPYTSTTRLVVEVSALHGGPLANASVTVNGASLAGTTDSQGLCTISGIRPGTYTIGLECHGYKAGSLSDVVVKLGRTKRVKGELES